MISIISFYMVSCFYFYFIFFFGSVVPLVASVSILNKATFSKLLQMVREHSICIGVVFIGINPKSSILLLYIHIMFFFFFPSYIVKHHFTLMTWNEFTFSLVSCLFFPLASNLNDTVNKRQPKQKWNQTTEMRRRGEQKEKTHRNEFICGWHNGANKNHFFGMCEYVNWIHVVQEEKKERTRNKSSAINRWIELNRKYRKSWINILI